MMALSFEESFQRALAASKAGVKKHGRVALESRDVMAAELLGSPVYTQRFPHPEWSIPPTVLSESRLMSRAFPGMSKNEHFEKAAHFSAMAKKYEDQRNTVASDGARAQSIQARRLAQAASIARDAALAHWAASGKKRPLP